MEDSLFKNIINNFRQQMGLYQEMKSLAIEQLALLGKIAAGGQETSRSDLNSILLKRQELMEQISELNRFNHKLQEKLCQQVNIEEFTLAGIKIHITDHDYREVEKVLAELGNLLADILADDQKNQVLFSQVVVPSSREASSKSLHQVSQAYREAMKKPPLT